MQLSEDNRKEFFEIRIYICIAVFAFLFFIILARVWHLQIFNGKRWRVFSEANRIELKKVPAVRGKIVDRNGVILAKSSPSFDLMINTQKIANSDKEQILDFLAGVFQWSDKRKDIIKAKVAHNKYQSKITIERNIDFDQMSKVLTHQYELHGVSIGYEPTRIYPYGVLASHILGYLGEIGKKELKKINLQDSDNNSKYDLGDYWGVSGIEKKYEPVLKGKKGTLPVVEDARGRELSDEKAYDLLPSFQEQKPISGDDVKLTIDSRLQKVLEDAFEKHDSGSAVLFNIETGEILALLSYPSFKPQEFARGVSTKYWRQINKNNLNPMYNRAVKGVYPPGSTFKMVTAHAALQEKVIDPKEKIFCPGYYRLGREVKRCWNRGGHGWMDAKNAIKHSCDVYFYEVGKRLGIDKIAEYARRYGLGQVTGIQYQSEAKGLVPDSQWKQKVYEQPWVAGETLSVAIGQGYLQTSVLQMARMVGGLVKGYLVSPTLDYQKSEQEVEKKKVDLPNEIQEIILQGMYEVVNTPGGTAYWGGRSSKIEIAGKTGTAQVVSFKAKKQLKDHAWFVAYAPAQDPKVAAAVIVEHGGHGGAVAAPIIRQVMDAYEEYYINE
ncbi:penicillin-binding protein 2 [bacterium]|nr:penicillin-binding protein 2 [bacterium]